MNNALSRLAFSATLLASATAFAQAPALIPLQGFVTDDNGEPLDGELVLDVRLLTSSVDGDELHVESQVVDADMGYFATDLGLGDELDLTIFSDNAEVWVEIAIDEEVLEPRIQFGTVPYAAWADSAGDAQTIGGVTLEELQAATDWSELTGIPEDLLDGDDVGEEVDLSGYQLSLTGECPEGSSLRVINPDGTFECEDDTDTDTDTTYSAGTGLSLLGTVFSIADDAINSARLADNAVANEHMQNDAVGNAEMRDNAIGNAEMLDDAIGSAEIIDASVTAADLAYGAVLTLPMFPNAPASSCSGSTVGGAMFGSTTSTSNTYVGNMFYSEDEDALGLRHNFARARLQVTCRGNGVMELMDTCSRVVEPIATVDCAVGTRPWTATSDEFVPATASWNFRVRSDSGASFEWANPQVILY